MPSTISRHLIVHGRVQGVYFRASCEDMARRLGVAGWVRNRDDGAVELVAQGSADAVEELVRWCHQGPRQASVTSVEVGEAEVDDRLSDFRTRY
ncbi:acylphosphatase [Aeromicrobium sp. PE09-221]|uniref:acylphosphatase n=1 Tax=Aeromicrobium sp. PE09-221 TaxID=1898043 RepID=UPI000B3E87FF|nr:acylphosphatase [Aeromicrobium sp. PE09-221]OUZ07251.1 acylphosphatase [Aeromicrobium sp. PE09-221]